VCDRGRQPTGAGSTFWFTIVCTAAQGLDREVGRAALHRRPFILAGEGKPHDRAAAGAV
jgi:hypothetical protein